MTLALNILASAIISAATLVGLYNYAPQNTLTISGEPMLGATITTIQGTDTLSNSRSTINTNFANLNSDKLEITGLTASTSITAGTFTTGVWNATTIGVAYGGTGSTTLSQFSVLLGSSTNAIGMVNGLGTSGQFLTSQGAGLPPQWTTSAVDQALAYNWTGHHTFTSLFATLASSTSATTTNFAITGTKLKVAGNEYVFPSSSTSASTTLPFVLVATTTSFSATGSTASTTLYTYTLVANEMGVNTQLNIKALCRKTGAGSGANYFAVKWGTGSATTTLASGGQVSVANSPASINITLANNNSQSAQSYSSQFFNPSGDNTILTGGTDTRNTATQLYIAFEGKLADGADTSICQGITITKY